MARPRKNEGVDVRLRMYNAFWKLLEDNNLLDITIGMIVEGAKCNRGSFYYHFDNIHDFIDHAILRELKADGRLPMRIFVVAAGASNTKYLFQDYKRNVRRMSLIMKQGGYEIVREKILRYMQRIWTALLCEDPEELTLEAKFVLTYVVGGLLSVMQRFGQDVDAYSTAEGMYLSEVGTVAVHNICASQGIDFDEALERLRTPERIVEIRIDD